jgi:hypothetical protein
MAKLRSKYNAYLREYSKYLRKLHKYEVQNKTTLNVNRQPVSFHTFVSRALNIPSSNIAPLQILNNAFQSPSSLSFSPSSTPSLPSSPTLPSLPSPAPLSPSLPLIPRNNLLQDDDGVQPMDVDEDDVMLADFDDDDDELIRGHIMEFDDYSSPEYLQQPMLPSPSPSPLSQTSSVSMAPLSTDASPTPPSPSVSPSVSPAKMSAEDAFDLMVYEKLFPTERSRQIHESVEKASDFETLDKMIAEAETKKYKPDVQKEAKDDKGKEELSFQPYDQMFGKSDRVINIVTEKKGKIRRLRDDKYEQADWLRSDAKGEPRHYHYEVDYDDGTFDTAESSALLKRIR